jgi:hypothetical protein
LGRKIESATRESSELEGGATERTPREGDSKDNPNSRARRRTARRELGEEERERERKRGEHTSSTQGDLI